MSQLRFYDSNVVQSLKTLDPASYYVYGRKAVSYMMKGVRLTLGWNVAFISEDVYVEQFLKEFVESLPRNDIVIYLQQVRGNIQRITVDDVNILTANYGKKFFRDIETVFIQGITFLSTESLFKEAEQNVRNSEYIIQTAQDFLENIHPNSPIQRIQSREENILHETMRLVRHIQRTRTEQTFVKHTDMFEIPAVMYRYNYPSDVSGLMIDMKNLDFEKYIVTLTREYTEYGFCLVSSWITTPTDKLSVYLVVGRVESMDTLEKDGVICNLKKYSSTKAVELRENCPKKFPTSNNSLVKLCSPSTNEATSLCFITPKEDYIVYLNYGTIGSIPTFYDFIKEPSVIRKRFWSLVEQSMKALIKKNVRFQITIHVGPCNQQGNPQFHVKIGPNVGKCSIGRHPKLQECKNSIGHRKAGFKHKPLNIV